MDNMLGIYQIPRPRLYHGRTLAFQGSLNPVSVSLDMNIVPLSTGTIVMPSNDDSVQPRWFVELFTSQGSMGLFRVRNAVISYNENTADIDVESAVAEIGDYFVTDKYETMMSPSQAIATIFGYYTRGGGTFWTLDMVEGVSFSNERLVAVSCDHGSVLEALMHIMEQLPSYMMKFDYSVKPWKLSFAKRPTTVEAECRVGRNISSMTISYDDSEMCTKLWYEWQDLWHMVENTTAQASYGIIEKTISVSNDGYAEEITTQVYDYLSKHDHPKISIEIEAEDLSRFTGQQFDTLTLGKRCRVVIPHNGSETYQSLNIMQISWDDVYSDQASIRLVLEEEEDAVWEFVRPELSGGDE